MTTSAHTLTDGKNELLDLALSSPKVQAIVASGTTGLAIDYNIMSWLPPVISLVGGIFGIVISVMIIRHKHIQMKHTKLMYQIDKKKLEAM